MTDGSIEVLRANMENLQLRIASLEGMVYLLAERTLSKEAFRQYSEVAQAVPSILHEHREQLKNMRQVAEAEDTG